MTEKQLQLKRIIEEQVFVQNKDEQINIARDPEHWLFDFRRILMKGAVADLVSDIFLEEFAEDYPFQLGTIEIAGVPLVTSLMNKLYQEGKKDINAFFIRKSRKKTGLMRMVEGVILNNYKIVLVDDTMNFGNSFWRQVTVLEELGFPVDSIWSIIRYRDTRFYKRFTDKGIKVRSLFELNDFSTTLGPRVQNFREWQWTPPKMPFEAQWVFKSEKPSYNYVVPKSQPVLDEERLYFGTDNRTFYAINQVDGSVAWKHGVGVGSRKKSIFSNPALYKDLVIFGSYDGNVYALERSTGKKRWVSFEADWVGSSPAVADDLGLIFVGLEFGLFRKHGGIAAVDAGTGATVWIDRDHPAYTHSSPHYIKKHREVVIGSNDGVVRLYNAATGEKKWEFTDFGGASFDTESDAGFGEGDIKESFAYEPSLDYLIFGAIDGFLYILKRSTGDLVHYYKCDGGIFSTPYIYKDKIYFVSTDKHLRCIDLKTLQLLFEINLDGTRLFGSPTVINGRLYVGTNAARLHELDPDTGDRLGYFQATERITNTLVYNLKTDKYFLPTYANEIICLKRKEELPLEMPRIEQTTESR